MADHFDRLEHALGARTEALYGSVIGERQRSRRWRPALPAMAGAVACLAAAGVWLISSGSATRASQREAGPSVRLVSLTAEAHATFVDLRQGVQPSDTLPPAAVRSLPPGVQAGQSRLLTSTPEGTAWLVPGSPQMCIVMEQQLQTGASSDLVGCSPTAEAIQNGMVAVGDQSSPLFVAGVLPDGASGVQTITAAGAAQGLTTTPDHAFTFADTDATHISFVDSAGILRTLSIPMQTHTPPSPPNPCPSNASWCR